MAGMDKYRHSSSKRVEKFVADSLALTESCPDKKKKKKNMDKMGKLCYKFAQNWYFNERFGTQLILTCIVL